ncbi:type II/IV secretion system protein [Candidatus Kaiserbacteria bacterium]|nr:type II/IV secretion system protein [Candidatus Kaiserbacteria bacterium]
MDTNAESHIARFVCEELQKAPHARSIVQIVEAIVWDAHRAGASDVHFDPTVESVRIRFRIDGMLNDVVILPRGMHAEMISRIKILSSLRTDEHQAAQDGRFRITAKDWKEEWKVRLSRAGESDFPERFSPQGDVDVRVSIVPTYHGENAVMRLLSDQAQEFTLESLGFTPHNADKILRAARKPYGMILATGPTGSGKTTTLYTLVKILNHPDVSVLTIEDPIEYSLGGVNQIQVNARTGLTFANGLRSMLRQDPNIIMVGEIRDMETAGLAVNTALTGHLILSTLHTNDAPTTLPRLLDMKVEPYLIASTVTIAIGQRLVRRICKHCKEARQLTDAEKKSLQEIMPADLLKQHQTFYAGRGCNACNGTGYQGRAGMHEVMEIDGPIRDAVLRKSSAAELHEIAIKHGMVPMIVDGLMKAAQGVTTIEEVLRMRYE